MTYIRAPEIIHLSTEHLYHLTSISHLPEAPTPSNHYFTLWFCNWQGYVHTHIHTHKMGSYKQMKVLLFVTTWMNLEDIVLSEEGIREGNGNPLQYSCLENPMHVGAWQAAVHGVARSRIRLSNFTFIFHFHALEKEMVTHSNVLAWRIPGMGEPGGLPSMGSHRVGHN